MIKILVSERKVSKTNARGVQQSNLNSFCKLKTKRFNQIFLDELLNFRTFSLDKENFRRLLKKLLGVTQCFYKHISTKLKLELLIKNLREARDEKIPQICSH